MAGKPNPSVLTELIDPERKTAEYEQVKKRVQASQGRKFHGARNGGTSRLKHMKLLDLTKRTHAPSVVVK